MGFAICVELLNGDKYTYKNAIKLYRDTVKVCARFICYKSLHK